MNHSMLGLSIHHQLPEFTQTHVHRVVDAIQPSHPLSSPLLLSPIPPNIRVFFNESALHMRWPKYWSFSISPSNEHSGLVSFRMDCLDLSHSLFYGTFLTQGLKLGLRYCRQILYQISHQGSPLVRKRTSELAVI